MQSVLRARTIRSRARQSKLLSNNYLYLNKLPESWKTSVPHCRSSGRVAWIEGVPKCDSKSTVGGRFFEPCDCSLEVVS